MRNFLRRRTSPLRPAAVVAANWWANHLDGSNRFSLGSTSSASGMIVALGAQHHVLSGYPDDTRVGVFQSYLARAITTELEKRERRQGKQPARGLPPHLPPVVTLTVDYGPEGLLREALVASDTLDLSMSLPVKSAMEVTDASVKVKPGYGANYIELTASSPREES